MADGECSVTCSYGTQQYIRNVADNSPSSECTGLSRKSEQCRASIDCPGNRAVTILWMINILKWYTIRVGIRLKWIVTFSTKPSVYLARDCIWSEWEFIDQCSTSCGGGYIDRKRSRLIRNEHGGNPCTGPDLEDLFCNMHSCPGTE